MATRRGTAPAILRAAEQAAKVADRLGNAFAVNLRRVLRQTERALPDILASVIASDPLAQGAQVGATRQQIRAALRRAGFDALAEGAYGPALDPVVKRVLALRRAGGLLDAELTVPMQLRLDALGALYRLDLLAEGDVASRALWRAAVRGVFGGSETRTILDELAKIVDRTEPQIRTLYDTSVSVLGRQVEALQAGDDPETLFAYWHPVDGITRPWCLKHAGKVYSRREIDAMTNDSGPNPPWLFCGGWNCRGQWSELSKASELRDLHGTNERIPEVATQLAQLPEAA